MILRSSVHLLLALLISWTTSNTLRAEPGDLTHHLNTTFREVKTAIEQNMDFPNGGGGTGELARDIRKIAEVYSEIEPHLPTFEQLRSYVLEMNGGMPAQVYVNDYPRSVEAANTRLKAAGIDFVEVAPAPQSALPPLATDFGADNERLAYWQSIRLPVTMGLAGVGAVLPVAFAAGPSADPRYLVALSAGATAAVLEFQFGWGKTNAYWAKIWDKFGFPANVMVNWAYPTIIGGVMLLAETALSLPPSQDPKEFVVKTMGIMTAAFVASFGAAQIQLARNNADGQSSNFQRYRYEALSCLWNGFGRMIALGAMGLGIEHSVASVWGVNFGVGEAIGTGFMLAFFAAVTTPLYLNSWFGNTAYDKTTAEIFNKNSPVSKAKSTIRASCRYMLAKLANSPLYMLGRTPAR